MTAISRLVYPAGLIYHPVMTDRLEQLKKLHTADPKDPFLAYGIALELAKEDALEEAVTWLDQTLALDANYCYAYYQKAKMLSEMGEDQQAQTAISQGLEAAQRSNDTKAYNELLELQNDEDF